MGLDSSNFMKNNSPTRIFIVEDDPVYVRLVKYTLEMDAEHEIHVFTDGRACLNHLHLNPSIISLDYSLPDMTGEAVLKKIKAYNKDIGIIILSGQNDVAVAVQLLKDGANDYIVKDDDTKNRLYQSVQILKKNIALTQEVAQLKDELGHKFKFDNTIKGNSRAIQGVFKLLQKAVKTNITVSVTGETGTGKELVAKSIHYNSEQRKGNFVAVNVSAIPKDLLESELFGYEKGAFTGANTRKLGHFELANNGTLFLDEIGEMHISLQAKLLRAIQEREFIRIGGAKPIRFDARIIVATHRNLADEVENGNFREDLYYRLLGLPIELPPLRDRGNDIVLLAIFFLNDFIKNNKLDKITITKKAKEKLLSYSFPGNVRELKAIIELSAVMCEENTITVDDIKFNSPKRADNFLTKELTLKDYNNKIIKHFLDKYDRDVLLVAKKLNIGKSTIYRMLKDEEL